MSLKDFKIKQSDIDTKGVVGAPDVLSGTAAENKMIFDRLIREAVRNYYNDLVDALEQYGVESIAQNAGKVKKLRLNDDGYLEVSEDGVNFKVAGSGGHKIVGQDNKLLPDRTTMWFQNAEVTDSGSSTVVRTKPDWTDVKNKPLVGEKTVFFEWSEGYVPEDWVGPNEWRGFYKVSSTPLSREELVGCVVEYTTADGINGEVTITEEMIDEVKNGEVLVAYINDYVDIYLGIPICSVETTFELGTLEMVLDRGLWVAYDDPGVGDTITKISKVSGETWDKALMPKIEKKDLPPIASDEVKFTKDLITTYEIGSITLEKGKAVIPAKGKSLQEVWDTIFVTEKNPTVEKPKVLLTVPEAKAYEVGEKVHPHYSAELYPGSYEYGPATGVTAERWEVTTSEGFSQTSGGKKVSGDDSPFVVKDDTNYVIVVDAEHSEGATPFTSLGNELPGAQITRGVKRATSEKITGYRSGFFGTAETKDETIDSDFIRGLETKTWRTPAEGDVWNLAIPVGAMRIAFAYPATIRDVSSVLDVNGLNAEIKSAFTKYTVSVEGANGYKGIDYKVYVLDRAAAATKANTFKITI